MLELEFDSEETPSAPVADVQLDAPQKSEAWHRNRMVRITGSRMKDAIAFRKDGTAPLKARTDYIGEVVAAMLTDQPKAGGEYPNTIWGDECEPYAREAIEVQLGVIVNVPEFLPHPSIPYIGCSPDGLFDYQGEKTGCEIKSPANSYIHLTTLLDGMPDEHMPQVQTEMWCADADRWLFASFDPRFSGKLQLYTQWIQRDEQYLSMLKTHCESFWQEVTELHAAMMKRAAA